jgi:hypothetical protein
VALGALLLGQARAVTMDDLTHDSKMTPKRFANHFEDFTFEAFPFVEDPNVFLQTQNGCCQDYAILGAYVMGLRKYDTHIIRVLLVSGEAHDVCYVTQAKVYLDYNLRTYFTNVQRSGPRIREIASKVADSFDQNWTSASEYTYTYSEGVKHVTLTVVKTDPPAADPDLGGGGTPPPR